MLYTYAECRGYINNKKSFSFSKNDFFSMGGVFFQNFSPRIFSFFICIDTNTTLYIRTDSRRTISLRNCCVIATIHMGLMLSRPIYARGFPISLTPFLSWSYTCPASPHIKTNGQSYRRINASIPCYDWLCYDMICYAMV